MTEKSYKSRKYPKNAFYEKKTSVTILQWFSTRNTMMSLVLTLTPKVIFKVISRTTLLYYGKIRIMDCMTARKIQHPEIIAEWIRLHY